MILGGVDYDTEGGVNYVMKGSNTGFCVESTCKLG